MIKAPSRTYAVGIRARLRVQAFTFITKDIPIVIVIVATVTPVPSAFQYIVGIVAVPVIHQAAIGASVKLGIQALAIAALLVPVGSVIVTTVAPIPTAFWYIVNILAVFIIHQVTIGAKI